MTEENLSLWDSVSKTDPAFTKKVDQKGGFTSINPYYQMKEATKLWGPYGSTWGLKNIGIHFHEGYGFALLEAVFFCPETEFCINNAIEPISSKGRKDPDFMKKLETDTITKALSRLGFNADVFMAQFDNLEYVAERIAETELEKTENKQQILEQRYNEIRINVEHAIQTLQNCPTIAAVKSIKDKALIRAQRELNAYRFRPDQFDQRLNQAAEKRIAEIHQGNIK